jgi:hypothetical protein
MALGKTTLLDVPMLLGDLLRERAIGEAFTEWRDIRQKKTGAAMVVHSRIPKSVSMTGCLDPAFHRFRHTLHIWFPEESV